MQKSIRESLTQLLAAGAVVMLTVPGQAFFAAAAVGADKLKVVYHISEAEKVPFALNNIRNHIKGVGGADNVEIIVVAHGPGLRPFHAAETPVKISSLVSELQLEGVAFNACGNTMNAMRFALSDLLPDFVRRDEGGVVRLAELQSKGYVYIRP